MRTLDLCSFGLSALRAHPLRTALSVLGIAVGVAAVILLTSIGEGARKYVVSEVAQFGTNILQVSPGKTETVGIPGVLGGTTRKLTLEDALALRRIPGVEQVVPVVMGQARVHAGGRGRSVYVMGVTADALGLWKLGMRAGRFLPRGDPRRGGEAVVLGPKLAREVFPDASPIGQRVRIGERRLRVLGITQSKGRLLGFDMDDIAYVDVATGMRLFDVDELIEIDVTFQHEDMAAGVVESVRRILTERHAGHEDFTVLTQAQMLGVFDAVIRAVTLAVGGIAGISLLVGAIGILTMMWIAVGERTAEIGLLLALGAPAGTVQRVFLVEAVALSSVGGLLGIGAGLGLAYALRLALPGLPVEPAPLYVAAATLVSVGVGLASGVAPARRAARLDPIEALRAE
ncbi:MAG: FtsX-like permease family protein [bacterium]|nr:FtsX-like permease family protein [bacterium]